MGSHPSAYEYLALDEQRREIRLIEKIECNADGELKLQLKHAKLDDVKGKYVALSYEWGDDETQHHVWLNGHYILVRHNLWRFLKHYVNFALSRTKALWTDSICINQTLSAEKSWQVQMMGDIYRFSGLTVVWLGAASEDNVLSQSYDRHRVMSPNERPSKADSRDYVQGGLPMVRRLFTRNGKLHGKASYQDESYSWRTFLHHHVLVRPKPGALLRVRSDICRILRNSYWTRFWILQEIILSPVTLMVVGDYMIPLPVLEDLQDFQNACFRCRKSDEIDELNSYLEPSRAGVLYSLVELYVTKRLDVGLHWLLMPFSLQKCSNPKDVIYSLLSLLDWQSNFKVDYDSDTTVVFTQAITKVIQAGSSIDRWHELPQILQNLLSAGFITLEELLEFAKRTTQEISAPLTDRLYRVKFVLESLDRFANFSESTKIDLCNIHQKRHCCEENGVWLKCSFEFLSTDLLLHFTPATGHTLLGLYSNNRSQKGTIIDTPVTPVVREVVEKLLNEVAQLSVSRQLYDDSWDCQFSTEISLLELTCLVASDAIFEREKEAEHNLSVRDIDTYSIYRCISMEDSVWNFAEDSGFFIYDPGAEDASAAVAIDDTGETSNERSQNSRCNIV